MTQRICIKVCSPESLFPVFTVISYVCVIKSHDLVKMSEKLQDQVLDNNNVATILMKSLTLIHVLMTSRLIIRILMMSRVIFRILLTLLTLIHAL